MTALHFVPSTLSHIPTSFTRSCSRKFMVKMSINSTPSASAIPINTIVVQGGGNTGNAMTCAARLGLTPRIISKVADDSQGKRILNVLEADGIDTSFIVENTNFHLLTRVSADGS